MMRKSRTQPPRSRQDRSGGGTKKAYRRSQDKPSGRKKPKGDWIKGKSVWRNDKEKPATRQPPSQDTEEQRLKAAALASLGPGGYKKFGDIPAHKLGRELRVRLYQIAGGLGEDESGNLKTRIKYAATSVTATLATGFGEGTFRAAVGQALLSRGALFAIQDHLEQLHDEQMLSDEPHLELKKKVDETVVAINGYLGELVREQNQDKQKN
ncbi:MAG: four helix bundle protein [Deltaproteobacteria bacterium]|nr:four helix bundle protein [Deltaproteobacteria bacterium]